MNANGIVTLLSDFGSLDCYVGIMKGVMLQINPTLTIVDLTHHIPAQNIELGAFHLHTAYPHFPTGSVHVAIVDPGVGSERQAIALETTSGYFVGPDNGLFSAILHDHRQMGDRDTLQAVALTNPDYWYTRNPSSTFQGRDIFVAVGAHLASGTPITVLGKPIPTDSLIVIPQVECEVLTTGVNGTIIAMDGFGNAITNIPGSAVYHRHWRVKVGGSIFPGQSIYSAVKGSEPLSLVGSHGQIELAIRDGNAQQTYGLNRGDRVQLQWTSLEIELP